MRSLGLFCWQHNALVVAADGQAWAIAAEFSARIRLAVLEHWDPLVLGPAMATIQEQMQARLLTYVPAPLQLQPRFTKTTRLIILEEDSGDIRC